MARPKARPGYAVYDTVELVEGSISSYGLEVTDTRVRWLPEQIRNRNSLRLSANP
jgi:hypothetical protein